MGDPSQKIYRLNFSLRRSVHLFLFRARTCPHPLPSEGILPKRRKMGAFRLFWTWPTAVLLNPKISSLNEFAIIIYEDRENFSHPLEASIFTPSSLANVGDQRPSPPRPNARSPRVSRRAPISDARGLSREFATPRHEGGLARGCGSLHSFLQGRVSG